MQEIYFDNAATTQVEDRVIAQMIDIMKNEYGNPSSLHSRGVAAERRFLKAEQQLLTALGAKDGMALFTSGGTESNNLALFGAADAMRRRGNRIVTTSIEHSSVLSACDELARRGFEVTRVSPESNGIVDPQRLLDACGEGTILVSMMLVNNEVGTIQPVASIARDIHRNCPNALVHADAVQAFGKIDFSVAQLGVDLLSLSGHKIHAPKGIGALYVAKDVRISPLLYGGSQQHGLRPGTESVPLAVALGTAAQEICCERAANTERVRAVRARLVSRLQKMPGITFNSPDDTGDNLSPYLLNISIPGYHSETMIHFLAQRHIYVSGGSACSKGAKSHVLTAMGCSVRDIDSSLRISLCKYNVVEQADAFAEALAIGMQELRRA